MTERIKSLLADLRSREYRNEREHVAPEERT